MIENFQQMHFLYESFFVKRSYYVPSSIPLLTLVKILMSKYS